MDEVKEAKTYGPEIEAILDQIEKFNVLQLKELKEAYEERFGVEASAGGMMIAAMPQAAGDAAPAEVEQTDFDVVLTSFGDAKIQVIKVVRELTGKGLKDAKVLVDKAPCSLFEKKLSKAEAEKAIEALAGAGATAELK
ncbi:MAG: 50S ribosomal protein L7/L12 [Planctomycetota bacterium]|nr:MAG: 50S ribosomal protein L7/L12 [Planctomycetota bacterium]